MMTCLRSLTELEQATERAHRTFLLSLVVCGGGLGAAVVAVVSVVWGGG